MADQKVNEEGEQEEEEMPMIEEVFRVLAFLLVSLYENKYKKWNQVVDFYNQNFKAKVIELLPLLLEDNLFEDIKKKVGDKYG